MRPETFDSRDLGEVEAFVSRIYSRTHLGAVAHSVHAHIVRRVLTPGICFDELDYDFDIVYSSEPQGLLIICDVVSSTISRNGGEPQDTFGPGDQFLISRPDLPYAGVGHASRLRFTLLDPALLTRAAESTRESADPQPPVQVLDHRPVSRGAQLQLQHCISHVRDQVMSSPDSPPPPLLVSAATNYLAATVLLTYRNTAVVDATEADHRDASSSTLRRAVGFIEANPDLELTVADIAGAAYVSVRALQLAFRHHLNTTPMAHLRRVRLELARDDLLATTPGAGRTVTAIAARWGFTSSRFNEQYRKAYGERPSETLRR